MTARPKVRGLGLDTGQEGMWGIAYTAIQAKTFATDSRLLYVQPNNPLATDGGNTGEDPTTPFATVTAALARCRDFRGDIILVGANDAWAYGGGSTWTTAINETLTVNVHGVSIIGAHMSPLGVPWTPAGAGLNAIDVQALDVLIQGFNFMGNTSGVGIYAEWDGATLWGDNLTVRSCYFDDVWDTAIQLEYVWNGHIYDCAFFECDEYGIEVDPTGSGIADCQFHHNWFQNIGTTAMLLDQGERNNVYKNWFYKATAVAAQASPDAYLTTANGAENLVHHNTFACALPGPGNGDYNDVCTSVATDAWIQNYCLNGPSTTRPT